MKAVMLEVDERMLEERRRLGHDRCDEMWQGVLHMVPPAGGPHQGLGESYAKLDWYAVLGVREMLILDPATLAIELYRGSPEGPVRVPPGPDGSVRCEVLEAGLATIAGAIRVDWDGGQADVTTT